MLIISRLSGVSWAVVINLGQTRIITENEIRDYRRPQFLSGIMSTVVHGSLSRTAEHDQYFYSKHLSLKYKYSICLLEVPKLGNPFS